METETLDKFYLEWSQFTKARTSREIDMTFMLEWLDRRGGLGLDVHERIRAILDAGSSSPVTDNRTPRD